jgi:hypothetical protein
MAKEVMRRLRVAALVLSVFALGGCADGEIFKKFNLTAGTGVSTDARQRISYATERAPSRIDKRTVVCLEPSPDVATAVASSFQAGISALVSQPNAKIDAQVAASLATNFAESVAQLGERTATITVLRDALFRACEAYANGALSPASYALILSRYDVFAMTLMTSELAAGNFGRRLASLNSTSTIGNPEQTEEQTKLLGSIDTRVEAAKTALTTAKDAAEAANADGSGKTADEKKVLDDKLTQAKGALSSVSLEAAAVRIALTGRAFASSFAQAGEALSATRTPAMATQIREFQENYFEAIQVPAGPIYAACVSIFDNPPPMAPTGDGALERYRERFFSSCADLLELLPAILVDRGPIAAAKLVAGAGTNAATAKQALTEARGLPQSESSKTLAEIIARRKAETASLKTEINNLTLRIEELSKRIPVPAPAQPSTPAQPPAKAP